MKHTVKVTTREQAPELLQIPEIGFNNLMPGNSPAVPRGKIVEHSHAVAQFRQSQTDMRADVARTAGYQVVHIL